MEVRGLVEVVEMAMVRESEAMLCKSEFLLAPF
jgi:hypothetical protein